MSADSLELKTNISQQIPHQEKMAPISYSLEHEFRCTLSPAQKVSTCTHAPMHMWIEIFIQVSGLLPTGLDREEIVYILCTQPLLEELLERLWTDGSNCTNHRHPQERRQKHQLLLQEHEVLQQQPLGGQGTETQIQIHATAVMSEQTLGICGCLHH